MSFRTLEWKGDRLILLDQTLLPTIERYVEIRDSAAAGEAIARLVVRGAPAIGIAGAYGLALAALRGDDVLQAAAALKATRPTAVNLAWAVDRALRAGPEADAILAEARAIHAEEAEASRKMGLAGARLIKDGATVLTHCNAGALATAELGTALAVIRAARAEGKRLRVFADETRPVLQGARLTAWELAKDGFDVTVIPDGAAAHFIGRGEIDCAIVGADRIARNGDVANKIGTRGVAGAMKLAGRPFYVAAPWSTVDLSIERGEHIPIEERSAREVTHVGETRLVPEGVAVRNPAFDVTPAAWIWAIITERGVLEAPLDAALAAAQSAPS